MVQDITLMLILNESGGWTNSHNRTFSALDLDHSIAKVPSTGNILCVMEGTCKIIITGDVHQLRPSKTFGDWTL